jgi:hypothetical protein
VAQPIHEWIALTPERVNGDQSQFFRPILDAVDTFRTEYEKDGKTAAWLKKHALDDWPHFVTWVCWDRLAQQVDAFFSVGKIQLSPEDVGDVPFDVRRKPASEIKNLRRNVRARLSEDELVKKAVASAVAPWQEMNADEVTIRVDPAGAKLHRLPEFWMECPDKKHLWARFKLKGGGGTPHSVGP